MRKKRFSSFTISIAVSFMCILLVAPPAMAKPGKKKVDMTEVAPDVRDELVNLRFVAKHIGEGFKVRRSLHYSIIYNTSEEDVSVFETAIEKTYRACVKWSAGLGVDVHQPKEKLITHFFNDYREYEKYGNLTGGHVNSPNILGYFSFATNYTYFYNYRNTPTFKSAKENIDRQITQMASQLLSDIPSAQKKAIRKQILALRAAQNRMNSFGGDLTEETLQHEVAHQVLFYIGFHNRGAILQQANPRWLAEGIAQLFEPIDEGGGSGFGKVNKTTAATFHAIERQNGLFPIDGFVSDIRFFSDPGRAYPQSWALAHYLTRTRRKELLQYVNEINSRGGDYEPNPEKDLAVFEKYFGKVDKAWVKRFKKYMERVN